MSVETDQDWITADEIGREWRRLHGMPLSIDSPEYQELFARINARDNALYERYGKPHMEAHRGKWIAIAPDGRVIIRKTSSEVVAAATETFGAGDAAIRKLADFPGHQM
jgi:hypothetical protein